MHPGRCASVSICGVVIGFVGELHPKWRQTYDLPQAPVMFELDLDAILQRDIPVFMPVSKHQAVERDIAVMVNERVSYADLFAAVWAAPTSGLLCDVNLFDIYRPKALKGADTDSVTTAEKSMAVRLTLNGKDTTLTDDQIENVVQAVLASLAGSLSARQRA
jgi:phenylalanyl-tRNA synthetase beta chain